MNFRRLENRLALKLLFAAVVVIGLGMWDWVR